MLYAQAVYNVVKVGCTELVSINHDRSFSKRTDYELDVCGSFFCRDVEFFSTLPHIKYLSASCSRYQKHISARIKAGVKHNRCVSSVNSSKSEREKILLL
jgi:hypothetical protein